MTPEQTFDKISNTIVNTLIRYNKIEMGLKNVWLDGIKELLAIAGEKYTPAVHEKLICFCKHPVAFESGFFTFESRFKNFITPPILKLEKKERTIDDIFDGYTEAKKLTEVIGWIKFFIGRRPLPKCYLNWVKQQDEKTKAEIRKYYKIKDNE